MSLRVTLDPPAFAIEPGRQVVCTVTVRNTGRVIERYSLAVVGTPAAWARLDPAAISLLPDTEREVTLTFHPPRQSMPHAGVIPFGVRVVPSDPTVDAVVEEGDITIQPFVELLPVLSPQTSRAVKSGRHRLHLTNAGNAAAAADISAGDPDQLLAFRIDQTHLDVGPGGTETATIVAKARQGKTFGTPEPHPFQVQVAPTDAPVIAIGGTMLQRALLPRWLPKAVLALVALVLIGAIFASRRAKASDVAQIGAPTTTLAPTTTTSSTKPPPTTSPATTAASATTATTATTGGSGSGSSSLPSGGSYAEPGLTASSMPCSAYDPKTVSAPTAVNNTTATTTPGATSTSTPPQLWQITANPPSVVTFTFSNPTDAAVAQRILAQESNICLIGQGGNLADVVMALEPGASATSPAFPTDLGAAEKCLSYTNPTPLPGPPFPRIVDGPTGTTIQSFANDADRNVGLTLAKAHTKRCWVGDTNPFVSLDNPDRTSILEYWR